MDAHIMISGMSHSLSDQMVSMAYQLFKEAFLGGQTYWDKDLTLTECLGWLREIDEKLGEAIKEYMHSCQYLSVFTGIEANQLKRIMVIGRQADGYVWKMITADFLIERKN